MKLLVSTDLGVTYSQVEEDDLDVLRKLGKAYDKEMLRWVIVDGEKVTEYCGIHRSQIVSMLDMKTDGEPVCMATDDPYMMELVIENGMIALTAIEMMARINQEKSGLS